MPVPFPSPTVPAADLREVLLTYLDYYRATVRDKVSTLPGPDRRRPLVPSGWSARDLVVHLTAMERRWLVWGFAVGAPGPRWDGAPPATLERVLLHVFQEYARHTGHLDVAVELAGGPTGE